MRNAGASSLRDRKVQRLPQHVGIIPDGNRRWAQGQGYEKHDGYEFGLQPGLELYSECLALGISEITFYGFTVDNTKRPSVQIDAFRNACVKAVAELEKRDADLLVVGNTQSALFPKELVRYAQRTRIGEGRIKVNFLVNYSWNWDLNHSLKVADAHQCDNVADGIASADISRMDLIVRWGGGRRLSGFLPVQSIYADIYVVDELWPDFSLEQFHQALAWYQDQDVTLGG
ncbi:MAG: di-trans,poly-cis-decaprenylcistransferase [Actinobacteria bacterium 21-64-8]|nr:MAG: di-trans,poly-cis-decaprenylcistransferase [Actinobacteria bacterium 21-64-8]